MFFRQQTLKRNIFVPQQKLVKQNDTISLNNKQITKINFTTTV